MQTGYVISNTYTCGIDPARAFRCQGRIVFSDWQSFFVLRHASRKRTKAVGMIPEKSAKEAKRRGLARDASTIVRGIVIPVDWDEEGNPVAASISSSGERDYFVEPDEKGRELLRLIREEIEVSGIVRKGIKGRNTIAVRSYRLKRGDNHRGKEEKK